MNKRHWLENEIIFTFFLLIGRFPLWMLFIALIIDSMPIQAFIPFALSIVIAKGYLDAYESNRFDKISPWLLTFWRNALKPILLFIFLEISLFSIFYVFLCGDLEEFTLLLIIFGCFIISCIAGMFVKPKILLKETKTLIKRTHLIKTLIVLLWIGLLLKRNSTFFFYGSIIFVYLLEAASTFKLTEIKNDAPNEPQIDLNYIKEISS